MTYLFACAILCSINVLPISEIQEYLVIGELSLDESILPVTGALPAAIVKPQLEIKGYNLF